MACPRRDMSRRGHVQHSETMKRLRTSVWSLAVVLLVVTIGCVPDRPLFVTLSDKVQLPERSVVIFFVDGLDRTRLHELIDDGKLPNIQNLFVEGGVAVEHAVSSLPSVTYPNSSTMLTGLHPGHHGILGNAWFDRSTLESSDYTSLWTYRKVNEDLASPTLYSLLDDELTISVQNHTRRDASVVVENSLGFQAAYGLGWYSNANCRVAACFEEVIRVANRKQRWPVATLLYFPGVDEIGHRRGVGSRQYEQAVLDMDRCLGWIADIIDDAGLADSTYLVLVSDHGMAPCDPDKTFELVKWLTTARQMRLQSAKMDDCDAVVIVDAGRVANIHLRGERGWHVRPEPAEVLDWINTEPRLHELQSVALVTLRDTTDRVRALSSNGSVVIGRRLAKGKREYRVFEYVEDPFRGSGIASYVAEGWRTSEQWLAATVSGEMPDVIPQLVELFDSPRTGDVVVFAEQGWAFERGNRSGHGSCLARDMRIPMYFAGHDLPAGKIIPHARLVDLMPTILGLLGKADRLDDISPIDGVNRAEQLRRPFEGQRN